MTTLNLKWVEENFNLSHCNIFDIGCADLHDTAQLLNCTNGNVFAFECNPVWETQNLERAKTYKNLIYYHCAISDHDGTDLFVPSNTLRGEEWNWSGSICPPDTNLQTKDWTWKQPVEVVVRSIDSVCLENQIVPNFIHIDAQGAEYKIFKDMIARPTAIWCEISEFENYQTGVTVNDFNNMMQSKGYKQVFKENCDALYVLKGIKLTDYS